MTTISRSTRRILIGVPIIIGICLFMFAVNMLYTQNFFIRPAKTNVIVITEPNKTVSNNFPESSKQNVSSLDTKYKKAVSRGCPFPQLSKFSQPLTNFDIFPCVKSLTPSETLKQNGRCVRTVNFPKDELANKTGCTMLKLGRTTPICTYASPKDKYVSGSLNANGVWEKGLVTMMLSILQKNPDMILFDGGCNIGVYTLAAALNSRHVVSVDASYENLFLVSKSLTHGNLWENVTLIWNAISQKHEMVVLRKEVDPNNVGGAEIDAKNKAIVGCDIEVNAIILDDLKDLLANKQVYMKLDIQGQEHNLLNYGKEFFKMVDVRYVQLEYVMHKGIPSGKAIIDSMISFGFLPFQDCSGRLTLKPFDEARWPFDMCFIRQKSIA